MFFSAFIFPYLTVFFVIIYPRRYTQRAESFVWEEEKRQEEVQWMKWWPWPALSSVSQWDSGFTSHSACSLLTSGPYRFSTLNVLCVYAENKRWRTRKKQVFLLYVLMCKYVCLIIFSKSLHNYKKKNSREFSFYQKQKGKIAAYRKCCAVFNSLPEDGEKKKGKYGQ